MIRIVLPKPLSELAAITSEISLHVDTPVSLNAVFTKLEETYPALRGTIRDSTTGKRRPMVRIFACEEDFSHKDLDEVLPEKIALGNEPLLIVGAIAGG